jgi:hypothetical protein
MFYILLKPCLMYNFYSPPPTIKCVSYSFTSILLPSHFRCSKTKLMLCWFSVSFIRWPHPIQTPHSTVSKYHIHFLLLALSRRICPNPRPSVTFSFCVDFFLLWDLLSRRVASLTGCYSLFNIFAATLLIYQLCPASVTWASITPWWQGPT